MQPLKVTWEFRSPMAVSTDPIHLDALLAWAVVNRAVQSGGYENPYEEQENLPLESAGQVWKASRLLFEPTSEAFLVPFIRKANIVDFADDKRKGYFETNKNAFTVGTGPYKAFDLRMPVQWMGSAQAWCVGDRDEIESLLHDVTAIGKWNKNGFGRVLKFTVEKAPDGEVERWRDRVLPLGCGLELPEVSYVPAAGRFRPPYWDRTNQSMIAIPQ